MSRIDSIIDGIIQREGSEYTNRPDDSGGPTKFGITLRTLSAFRHQACTPADVAALSEGEARAIYQHMYVDQPGFGEVMKLSKPIAEELVDTGVNTGIVRASDFLQRALNALNRQARDYPDITVDGDCGPSTLASLRAYLAKRGGEGETVLLRALNCLQGEFYIGLAERRPKDEDFVFGWLRARVS